MREEYGFLSVLGISEYPSPINMMTKFLSDKTCDFQSLSCHYNGTSERMSFGGIKALQSYPAILGSQIVLPSYWNAGVCLIYSQNQPMWVILDMLKDTKSFPIQQRFQDTNQVTSIPFRFWEDNYKIMCINY